MYSMKHVNIIKLITHFEDEEFIYLIMEFAPGKNISDLANEKKKQKSSLSEDLIITYIA